MRLSVTNDMQEETPICRNHLVRSAGLLLTAMLLVVGGILLNGCGTSEAENASSQADASTPGTQASGDEAETREVVRRHLDTFGAGDLEGILADYAEDAVMFTPNGPVEGKEAIRAAFEQILTEWGQPGTTFELTDEMYVGDYGYIYWTAETADNVYEYGVDGFVVRDGKIIVQFFGAKMAPKP